MKALNLSSIVPADGDDAGVDAAGPEADGVSADWGVHPPIMKALINNTVTIIKIFLNFSSFPFTRVKNY